MVTAERGAIVVLHDASLHHLGELQATLVHALHKRCGVLPTKAFHGILGEGIPLLRAQGARAGGSSALWALALEEADAGSWRARGLGRRRAAFDEDGLAHLA